MAPPSIPDEGHDGQLFSFRVFNPIAKIRREFRALRELIGACAPEDSGFRYDSSGSPPAGEAARSTTPRGLNPLDQSRCQSPECDGFPVAGDLTFHSNPSEPKGQNNRGS